MAKFLVVKRKYEDKASKIEATRVVEERGRLLAYDGENKVADFASDKIDEWSFETE